MKKTSYTVTLAKSVDYPPGKDGKAKLENYCEEEILDWENFDKFYACFTQLVQIAMTKVSY